MSFLKDEVSSLLFSHVNSSISTYNSNAATMADAKPIKHMPVLTLCNLPHFSTISFALASSSGV